MGSRCPGGVRQRGTVHTNGEQTMEVEVGPRNIKTGATDHRGRIYLGPEQADKDNVTIVVIDDFEE